MDTERKNLIYRMKEVLPLVDAVNAPAMTRLVDSVDPGVEHSMTIIDPRGDACTTQCWLVLGNEFSSSNCSSTSIVLYSACESTKVTACILSTGKKGSRFQAASLCCPCWTWLKRGTFLVKGSWLLAER